MAMMRINICSMASMGVGLLICLQPLAAQTSPRLIMQGQAENAKTAQVPRDALGRPCLDIESAARRRAVNPDTVDHVISIKNICPQLIKVKVCYVDSNRCNEEDVHAYKRVDTILGTMKGVTFFKYTLTQKVAP
jgi:hypothetical protein